MQAQGFRAPVIHFAKSVPVPLTGIGTHVPPDSEDFFVRQMNPVLDADDGFFSVAQQFGISVLIAAIRLLDVLSGLANVMEQSSGRTAFVSHFANCGIFSHSSSAVLATLSECSSRPPGTFR